MPNSFMLPLMSTFEIHPVISLRADVIYRNSCACGLQFGQRSDHQTPQTHHGKLSSEYFPANSHLTYERVIVLQFVAEFDTRLVARNLNLFENEGKINDEPRNVWKTALIA